MVLTDNIKDMFDNIRTLMGEPVRSVPIDDDAMCKLLKLSLGDYVEVTQQFIVDSHWADMVGKDKSIFLSNDELAYTLTARTLDWARPFQEYASKEVGLQARGTNPKYELKKDYFTIEPGKQSYVIPAGREINRVLYITPPTTRAAMFMQTGGLGFGFGAGMGFAQIGNMAGFNGPFSYVGSLYDTALMSAQLAEMNKFFRGDLSYRVTLGPEGTHIIHLLSVPGLKNKNTFGNFHIDDTGWGNLQGCWCWYTYYDVSTPEEADECRLEHSDTIIISPSEVPLKSMQFELLNSQAQETVRQLLMAYAMMTLGNIYGKFSGNIKIPNAEASLNWQLYHDQGKVERDRVLGELKERYQNMLPWKVAENKANEAIKTLEALKTKPFVNIYVR